MTLSEDDDQEFDSIDSKDPTDSAKRASSSGPMSTLFT